MVRTITDDWREVISEKEVVHASQDHSDLSPFKIKETVSPIRKHQSSRLSSLFDFEEDKEEEKKAPADETYVKNEETSFFFENRTRSSNF